MDLENFDFEFHTEISQDDTALWEEANERLRSLINGHTDIVDASVSIEELTGSETPYLFKARVVIYMRPENIAAVQKDTNAMLALQGALNAVKRQVRETRAKRREQWKRPDVNPESGTHF
ncbi:MAG: hypothetical protein ACLFTI_02900 [Anaerolineales bacterium]